MKKIFRTILAVAALPALLLTGCDTMDETNIDPTRMDSANAGSFLNPTLYHTGIYTWTRYNSWTFQLMQCLVTTNTTNGVGWYRIGDNAGDGAWTTYYKWASNAQAMYNYAVQTQSTNYQAIALTLQSWMFQQLTDAFGDVPMEEACRGEEQLYYPKFNTQQEVYQGIIDNLGRANRLYAIEEGLRYNDNGDLFYCTSGNDAEGMRKWQKFTNSLRLRALLRVIDVPELHAADTLRHMLAHPDEYPLFESNEEAARLHVTGVAPLEAPMLRPSDLNSYKACSKFFIDKLVAWNDPRLPIFAKPTTNKDAEGKEVTGYFGLPSGYDVEPTYNGSSPNEKTLATAPQDIWCLPYSEVLFIQAELAQRGLIDADAQALYEAAVTASAQQWGVELPAGYFDQPETAYDGSLKRIMEQKFYALFFVDYQQWFEYNRTGYPDVPTGPGVATGDAMPYRFRYPAIVQRMNREHYQQAVANMGGDELQTKLIWQKR